MCSAPQADKGRRQVVAMQVGPGLLTDMQQEAEEVRSQMSALKEEAGGLAQEVGPAVAALLAANPPYQPPPHEDKVIPAVAL